MRSRPPVSGTSRRLLQRRGIPGDYGIPWGYGVRRGRPGGGGRQVAGRVGVHLSAGVPGLLGDVRQRGGAVEAFRSRFLDWANARTQHCAPPAAGPPSAGPAGGRKDQAGLVADLVEGGRDAHARAMVVIPSLFALTFEVIGDPQMALFATFGGFATPGHRLVRRHQAGQARRAPRAGRGRQRRR